MRTTLKLALGLGIVSGALLTALLITGERGKKTRNYIVRQARNLKTSLRTDGRDEVDEPEIHYI
jgi:hypothetical protein